MAAATARITVVLPTPGRPVSRRAMVAASLRRLGVGALDASRDPDDRTRREADPDDRTRREADPDDRTRREADAGASSPMTRLAQVRQIPSVKWRPNPRHEATPSRRG
jgi:hypothetical protein